MTKAVFAIPGDKDRRTGGFLYEATVLRVLNEIGCETAHLQLPDSFPDPTAADMSATLAALCAVPPSQAIILDGLVFGAIDPDGLCHVPAPVIAMIHHPLCLETGLSASRAAFLRSNEARALACADHVIVPSPHTAQVLTDEFGADPDRISIALPGFKRPHLSSEPAEPPLILSVGLLARRKGHDILLSALSKIADLEWQAEIVGKTHDPRVAEALFRQRDDLGLQDRVQFSGELGEDALAETFNKATIFALATRYEGYGMVLSEAMLHGLPVVSCDAGAVSDTLDGAGVLVPPDEPGAFGGALRALLESSAHLDERREAARKHALSLPVWEDTARDFVRVINLLRKD